jgi:hypothetical protein
MKFFSGFRKICYLMCFIFLITGIFLTTRALIRGQAGDSRLMLAFPVNTSVRQSPLIGLDGNAKNGTVKKISGAPYAYFRFTDAQMTEFWREYEQNGDAALALTISLFPQKIQVKTKETPFTFGFLYKEDFQSATRLYKEIKKRPLVTANLDDFSQTERFTISCCFPASLPADKLPTGFFVYGTRPFSIDSAQAVRASVGWNREACFFGFAPGGGKISTSFDTVDFTGASSIFPGENSHDVLMPAVIFGLSPYENSGSVRNQKKISVTYGHEKLVIYRIKGQREMNVPAASLAEPFTAVSFTENADMVNSVLMVQSEKKLLPLKEGRVLVPYKCDPGLIPGWKKERWRTHDYELFEWAEFPGILFFDTLDYKVQSEFFRRIAFYVEKAGSRGKLLTDTQLDGLHGYNAHDYRADSLVSFFSEAEKQRFPLNAKEKLLCDILIANGIITRDSSGQLSAGHGAVISVSQESVPWLRKLFIAHEGWHGIFFTDAEFRNFVASVYYTIDPEALSFLKAFWFARKLNYDPSDVYLMHNEFMAYLMQQPLSATATYFLRAAGEEEVRKQAAVLAQYIQKNHAAAFEDAASVLNEYASNRWGLAAGRVWIIMR